METIANNVKSKKGATKKFNDKIFSMLELLEGNLEESIKEDLNIALDVLLRKRNERQVEEVKMLSEVKEPLLDLENCSLHELISILQKFASDPSINVNQAGFGSYIANHV